MKMEYIISEQLNSTFVFADFRFASYYQDHMVLQRSPQSAVLWGYGNVDSTVTIEVDGSVYKTSVKKGRDHSVKLTIYWTVNFDQKFVAVVYIK